MINELYDIIWEMSDPEELDKDIEARHCMYALNKASLQTLLPDRSFLLIGQKWVENGK